MNEICTWLSIMLTVVTLASPLKAADKSFDFEVKKDASTDLLSFVEGNINNRPFRVLFSVGYTRSTIGYSHFKPLTILENNQDDIEIINKKLNTNKKFGKFKKLFFKNIHNNRGYLDSLVSEVEEGLPNLESYAAVVILNFKEAPVWGTVCGWGCGLEMEIYYLMENESEAGVAVGKKVTSRALLSEFSKLIEQ